MHIKRFEGKSVSEALERVKAEFGEDAVIVKTNRLKRRNPETGLAEAWAEVVAAIDRDAAAVSQEAQEVVPETQTPEETAACQSFQGVIPESPVQALARAFSCMGIDCELQQKLAMDFFKGPLAQQLVSVEMVKRWLQIHCASRMKYGARVDDMPRGFRLAFIGPTGVGKTTTLAKIAARLVFKSGMKGALITTDSYRLGAVDQLKKYAQIMSVDFESVRDRGSLLAAFERHSDKDFVLVDTTGRGLWDKRHSAELGTLFETIGDLNAYVCLSATAKTDDLVAASRFYRKFPVVGWVITKMDETMSCSGLLTPFLCHDVKPSYISHGQRVPEDIKPADSAVLNGFLFNFDKMEEYTENKERTIV
ncbi:MAG: hypothetical protein PHC35_05690 [Deltaproteobacteria bacterium]|jgi:flagellar biosynthesis protein FlhF|nr:hypothetical protein [Deltaproteobacteria bacterium]